MVLHREVCSAAPTPFCCSTAQGLELMPKNSSLYQPGVTVTKLEVVNDNQLKVSLKVAPDAALGEYLARVRTAQRNQ